MPATLSILAAVFPVRERAAAIGAWSAVSGIGIVIGPTLGGLLLDHFAWGAVFWINVPLVAVALVSVVTVIPSMPGPEVGRAPGLDRGRALGRRVAGDHRRRHRRARAGVDERD